VLARGVVGATSEIGVRRAIGIAVTSMAIALVSVGARAEELTQELASVPATDVDRDSGAYFYTRYCAGCHGQNGRGTLIGFPLVDRPSGPVTSELVLEALRTPLQLMPSFPSNVINDEVAALIVHHIATLEHAATGKAVPPPPEVPVSALRPIAALPPAPAGVPADPRTYEMKEYDASACGAGHDLAVAPDGRVWYAGIERNNIVMFDPRGEQFHCWPIPTRNGRPQGLRVDRDGLVWFTLTGLPDNKIGMFDPKTELFSEFQLPHWPRPFPFPHTLVFDADRNPVVSLAYGDAAGRIDRKTGHFDIFPIPTYRAQPYGIEIARNGHIWMAESIANKLVEIDPRSGRATEFPHPRAAEDPGVRRIALDSRGNIWFSEHEFGSIGLFEPHTRRWRSWRAPANDGRAYGTYAVNVDRRDAIWFSHFGGNYIGRFEPRTEKFSIYPFPTPDTNCRLMDFAKDGALWCVSSSGPRLVRLAVKPGA
jgi:virginiamycin B lyase